MEDINACVKDLLRSLFNKHRIGGKHTEENNLFRRIKHLPKNEQKEIIEGWKICIQQEYVLRKISTGEIHVSLNPRKLKEILELINKDEG